MNVSEALQQLLALSSEQTLQSAVLTTNEGQQKQREHEQEECQEEKPEKPKQSAIAQKEVAASEMARTLRALSESCTVAERESVVSGSCALGIVADQPMEKMMSEEGGEGEKMENEGKGKNEEEEVEMEEKEEFGVASFAPFNAQKSQGFLTTESENKLENRKEDHGKSILGVPISIEVNTTNNSQQHPVKSAAEQIFKDANFSSFSEFEQAFEDWKQTFHHPFRVASSEKHEDRELAGRFRYRYVVYHCSRYGEPRKRGAGRRPHQNYLPCGCNAKLRLNFHAQNEGSLCVTTLVTEHNHPPISEDGSLLGGNVETGAGGGGRGERGAIDGVGRPNGNAKRRKSSPKEGSTGEQSPNSATSLLCKAENTNGTTTISPSFSPLSLQPALHNSPSSGGQSSAEGAVEASAASILALQQNRRFTTGAAGGGGNTGGSQLERKPSAGFPSPIGGRNHPVGGGKTRRGGGTGGGGNGSMISPLVKDEGGLNAATAGFLTLKAELDDKALASSQFFSTFGLLSPPPPPPAIPQHHHSPSSSVPQLHASLAELLKLHSQSSVVPPPPPLAHSTERKQHHHQQQQQPYLLLHQHHNKNNQQLSPTTTTTNTNATQIHPLLLPLIQDWLLRSGGAKPVADGNRASGQHQFREALADCEDNVGNRAGNNNTNNNQLLLGLLSPPSHPQQLSSAAAITRHQQQEIPNINGGNSFPSSISPFSSSATASSICAALQLSLLQNQKRQQQSRQHQAGAQPNIPSLFPTLGPNSSSSSSCCASSTSSSSSSSFSSTTSTTTTNNANNNNCNNPSSVLALLQIQQLLQQQASNPAPSLAPLPHRSARTPPAALEQKAPLLETHQIAANNIGPPISHTQMLELLSCGGGGVGGNGFVAKSFVQEMANSSPAVNVKAETAQIGAKAAAGLTPGRRAAIIQEADLLLQALVAQMIRTRDLVSYLRRLRQFLEENCG